MNAKEISDATLESVTPADNDLMLIYDTSAGTTGKATIADIAPKVAENIDIATLPAVTPAADDVLMIGDTSAGTTGKTTIADIAPKVAENIDISTLPAVTPAADDVLMIGDTSAGTTGKATIEGIKDNLSSDFATKTELQTVAELIPDVSDFVKGNNIVPRSGTLTIILQDSTLNTPLNFTASFSGLFFITLSKSNSGNTAIIFVNGTRVFQTANFVEAYSNVLFAFVRQGDTVSVQTDGNGSDFKIQTAGLQRIDWIIEA